MRFLATFVAVLTTLIAVHSDCIPDLQTLENEQKLLLHNIHESQIESAKLKNQLNHLQQSKIPNSTTLNVSNIVVDKGENPSSEEKGSVNYTAPIIVMLPEEPSDREKWEYAITLRCLGQKDFSAFDQVHNSKLLQMSTIKGTTVKEIQHEIKETENELKETKSELTTLESTLFGLKDTSYKDRTKKMHVVHNIKLVKHEIDILETKLNRLQKRLKAALLFSNNAAPKAPEKSHEEDEQADDNDEGENDTRTDYGDDIDEPPESDDDE